MYTPDKYVILEITDKDGKTFNKVFATWMGSYLSGEEWRMNSGIVKAEDDGDRRIFHGESGSKYSCHKDSYGVAGLYNLATLQGFLDRNPDNIKLLDSDPYG